MKLTKDYLRKLIKESIEEGNITILPPEDKKKVTVIRPDSGESIVRDFHEAERYASDKDEEAYKKRVGNILKKIADKVTNFRIENLGTKKKLKDFAKKNSVIENALEEGIKSLYNFKIFVDTNSWSSIKHYLDKLNKPLKAGQSATELSQLHMADILTYNERHFLSILSKEL